jgi:acetyl-CoA carboxylase biotin carboxyl carrier protein
MRLIEQSDFDELTLEMDGVKLCLRKGGLPERTVERDARTARAEANDSPGRSREPAMRDVSAHAAHASVAESSARRPDAATRDVSASAAHASAPQGIAPNSAATHADPNVHDVPSPLLGTFYRAPKPGAPPFIEVGSEVEHDTVVGIIEVMKLMNTVRAGTRGTVTEILIADGVLAEYGQPLLRVRKAG